MKLDAARFTTDATTVTPMKPGTRWTYREVEATGESLKIVLTATSVIKRIANGVTARVLRGRVEQVSARAAKEAGAVPLRERYP